MIRVNDKVMIPQDDHPDINFVGLLIGPRGNTLKTLEKEVCIKLMETLCGGLSWLIIFLINSSSKYLIYNLNHDCFGISNS